MNASVRRTGAGTEPGSGRDRGAASATHRATGTCSSRARGRRALRCPGRPNWPATQAGSICRARRRRGGRPSRGLSGAVIGPVEPADELGVDVTRARNPDRVREQGVEPCGRLEALLSWLTGQDEPGLSEERCFRQALGCFTIRHGADVRFAKTSRALAIWPAGHAHRTWPQTARRDPPAIPGSREGSQWGRRCGPAPLGSQSLQPLGCQLADPRRPVRERGPKARAVARAAARAEQVVAGACHERAAPVGVAAGAGRTCLASGGGVVSGSGRIP
jgi:hypothetical protein